MNPTLTVPSRPAGTSIRISGVDWRTYSRLLRAFEEKHHVRLTYDRGELEIMSPRLEHEDDSWFLGDLVFVLTEELGLPIKRGGSTTLRRRARRKGIEADACYWIANAAKMAKRRRIDLRTDPPPDLAIETDVTHSSMNRLPIYAALGVPEVWRLEGENLTFHVLEPSGAYTEATASRAFPFVAPVDILRFLRLAREADDENKVVRDFREWIRAKRT